MPEITIKDFAQSFGTSVDNISEECKKVIKTTDFSYRTLKQDERDRMILDALKKINSDRQTIGASDRQDVWQNGWAENLQAFIDSDFNLEALVPKFIRPNQAIRFNQDYIMPAHPMFELKFLEVFRLWLFKEYLGDADVIYEFGCGTGLNLIELAKMYPEKELHGLDFVPAPRDLVNKIGQVKGWNMRGHLFDMTAPDPKLRLKKGCVLFTFGAVEQLAGRFEKFLEFILEQSPSLCIHMEPTVELYDNNNLVDYLAIKFHEKRGYTKNFLPQIQKLEKEGQAKILKVKRLFFGSKYMEGYSYFIWQPLKGA